MNPATVLYTVLVILSSSLLENVDAQPPNSFDIIRSMASLNKVVENLQTQVEIQSNLLHSLATKVDRLATLLDRVEVTNEEIQKQGIQLDNLEAKAEIQETLLSNFSAMAKIHGTSFDELQDQWKIHLTFLNKLDAKVDLQVSISNNSVTHEELQTLARNLQTKAGGQATLLDTLVNKLDTQATFLNTVVTKEDSQKQALQLDNLEVKAELQEALLNNISAMAVIQGTLLRNMEAQAKIQSTALNKMQASIDFQKNTSNNLVTKGELQETSLKILHSNVTTVAAELQKLSKDFHKSVASTGTVEGIIAGTWYGVVVIPLGSGEQRKISSTTTYGVAFDWNARKVYWIDFYAHEIRRANLDGTSMELLISDNSTLVGLAVDSVTGNFYYGVQAPRNEIRVCGRSGQKCAVVASGAQTVYNIYDIALYPSEGIMFWSKSWSTNKTVVRADMNGANARVIISEEVFGICVDEASARLYGGQDENRIVASYDLNGNNRKILLSGRLDPRDVAVDGDTVYFGNDKHKSVYSVTQNGQPALITNTTGPVWHIALYGRNRVPSRRNPCHSSACPNVCVLTRDSYTCL